MNKKTSYIMIFSLLVVLTVGTIFTDYIKQHLATKGYVDTAMTGVVKTSGDQTIGGNKTFSNTIVGTGIITNISGGTRPTCDTSTRGLMWYEYGSSGQDDTLYICRKFSNDTYAYTAVTIDDIATWDCGDDFIDPRDFNIYPTVQIGTQCWMAKNLAYLPSVVEPGTGSGTTPYYYVYDYTGTDVSAAKQHLNYTTYGVLYNWPAALTACPTGWHLPTDAEFITLNNTTGHSDEALVSAGWINYLSFGGCRETYGAFWNVSMYAKYWTTTDFGNTGSDAWRWMMHTDERRYFAHEEDNKAHGFSVRCLRD